jgi:hypothetical protein
MKSARLTISAVLALFVVLTPAFAQSAGFRIQVPFEFAVGNHNLAAGEYKVTVMKPGMLQLERLDGRGTAAVMTTYTGGGPNQDLRPRLIFHSYGNHYFLSQVWIEDVNPGHELFASPAELEYARGGHQQQTTLVARGQSTK